MADLTTLDPNAPADPEIASQGASRIREERLDLLGFAGLEHALSGVHKFMFGGVGSRPAAGNPGRIFLNTTGRRIELDNGSAWVNLGAVSADYTKISSSFSFTTGINLMSHGVDVAAGANILFLVMTRVINTSGLVTQLGLLFGLDGIGTGFGGGEVFEVEPAGVASTYTAWGISLNQAAGVHNTGLTVSAAPSALGHIASQLLLISF